MVGHTASRAVVRGAVAHAEVLGRASTRAGTGATVRGAWAREVVRRRKCTSPIGGRQTPLIRTPPPHRRGRAARDLARRVDRASGVRSALTLTLPRGQRTISGLVDNPLRGPPAGRIVRPRRTETICQTGPPGSGTGEPGQYRAPPTFPAATGPGGSRWVTSLLSTPVETVVDSAGAEPIEESRGSVPERPRGCRGMCQEQM